MCLKQMFRPHKRRWQKKIDKQMNNSAYQYGAVIRISYADASMCDVQKYLRSEYDYEINHHFVIDQENVLMCSASNHLPDAFKIQKAGKESE